MGTPARSAVTELTAVLPASQCNATCGIVHIEQIDIVGIQPAKTVFTRFFQCRGLCVLIRRFTRDINLIPHISQRFRQQGFGETVAVSFRVVFYSCWNFSL